MIDKFSNFVTGYIKTPPSPADTGASLVIDAEFAGNFPDPAVVGSYKVVVADSGNIRTPLSCEIVNVTAKEAVGGGVWSDGTDCQLTIERVAEGTNNRQILANDEINQDVYCRAHECSRERRAIWLE